MLRHCWLDRRSRDRLIDTNIASLSFTAALADEDETRLKPPLLYLPSERSETDRYTVLLAFPSARPSVRTQYLDANISKTMDYGGSNDDVIDDVT